MTGLQPGTPPMWRLVIYALVAMAIPAYFFHPHLHESRSSAVLYGVAVTLSAGLVVFFALIPRLAKRMQSGSALPGWLARAAVIIAIIAMIMRIWLRLHYR